MADLFAAPFEEGRRMSKKVESTVGLISSYIMNSVSYLSLSYKAAEPNDFYIISRLPVLILRPLGLLSQCL